MHKRRQLQNGQPVRKQKKKLKDSEEKLRMQSFNRQLLNETGSEQKRTN